MAYTITTSVSPENAGTVTGAGTYREGLTIALTAYPAIGYAFIGWSKLVSTNDNYTSNDNYTGEDNYPELTSEIISTDNPYSFTVTEDASYQAIFEQTGTTTFTVSATSSDITKGYTTGGGVYQREATVTLSGIPNSSLYECTGWFDVTTSTRVSYASVYSFILAGDKAKDWNLQAIFTEKIPSYTATFSSNDTTMGTVSGGGSYNENSQVIARAVANTGYAFSGWYENGVLVSNSSRYAFTITRDITLVGVFKAAEVQPVLSTLMNLDASTVAVSTSMTGKLVDYDSSKHYEFTWGESSSFMYIFDATIDTSGNVSMLIDNSFEELITTSTSKQFILRVSKYDNFILTEYQYINFTVVIPDSFKPSISLGELEITDKFKNFIPLAGYSKFTETITTSMLAPSGYVNHATWTQTASINKGTCSLSNNRIYGDCIKAETDYYLVTSATVTDSRGKTDSTYSPGYSEGGTYICGYYAPYLYDLNVVRCNSLGKKDPNPLLNTCIRVSFYIDYTELWGANTININDLYIKVEDETYSCSTVTSDGEYFFLIDGGSEGSLEYDKEYSLSIYYLDEVMKTYGEESLEYITYTNTVYPLSLYDDKNGNVGATFGKEASTFGINFALNTTFNADLNIKAQTYNDPEQPGILTSTEKSAFDIVDRGGINSVSISNEDIESGVYANNLKLMTGEDYAALSVSERDTHTLYFLSSVPPSSVS